MPVTVSSHNENRRTEGGDDNAGDRLRPANRCFDAEESTSNKPRNKCQTDGKDDE